MKQPMTLRSFASSFMRERVALQIAREMFRKGREAQTRFFKLVLLMRPGTQSARAVVFLRRVSRCYLFGFDAECIVMCRSTLDAEFCAEISTDDCISIRGDSGKSRYYTLDDRIETATVLKRIDVASAKKARQVKKEGNKLIHMDPGTNADSLPIIESALAVIQELSRTRSKRGKTGNS